MRDCDGVLLSSLLFFVGVVIILNTSLGFGICELGVWFPKLGVVGEKKAVGDNMPDEGNGYP